MARKAEITGQATDWQGLVWDVRERRETAHGFNILVGWPQGEARGRGGRGVATIITAELARYLVETRLRDVDVPISLTAVKRLRREIGVSWSWDDWWAARSSDLTAMTLETFCAKHGCSMGAASQRRAALKLNTPAAHQSPSAAR